MKQKLEDLKLMIQNDRRIWAALAFLAVILITWGLTSKQGRSRPVRPGKVVQQASSMSSEKEHVGDLMAVMQQKIRDTDRRNSELERTVRRMQEDQKSSLAQTTQTMESLTNAVEQMTVELQDVKNRPATQNEVISTDTAGGINAQSDSLEPIGFTQNDVPPPPPPPVRPSRVAVISPGDTVTLTLLTGVNAPVDGTPYPVVFRVDGPISGPDGSSLDVGEARLLAAAQGSETDSRVIYRLTTLAMRHPDGRRTVVDVDGWITGEDGIRGMKGKLIDKLGRLILATAGVGFTAGVADSVASRNKLKALQGVQGLSIYGEDVDFAAANAFSDTANRIGQILLDRYEKLVPVVEVLPGRQAIAAFSRQSEVTILEDDDDGEGIYAASMD